MSVAGNAAWIEAGARALAVYKETDPDFMWSEYQDEALAVIRAAAPLIIEQCADIAANHSAQHTRSMGAYGVADVDSGRGRQEGHVNAGMTIAAEIRAMNHFVGGNKMVYAGSEANKPTVKPDLTVGDADLIARLRANLATAEEERDAAHTALALIPAIAEEIFERWDKDMRPAKLLSALSGRPRSLRRFWRRRPPPKRKPSRPSGTRLLAR